MAAEEIEVETLPLEKKLEILKKFNPLEYFNLGTLIDAQDTVNNWCLSEIMEADGKNVSVHFDGWSAKWDCVCLLMFTSLSNGLSTISIDI